MCTYLNTDMHIDISKNKNLYFLKTQCEKISSQSALKCHIYQAKQVTVMGWLQLTITYSAFYKNLGGISSRLQTERNDKEKEIFTLARTVCIGCNSTGDLANTDMY